MARRYIHYEAAFEDYVRSQGWPYVAVEEHRKAVFGGARIKSFDFLVHRPAEKPWLVDVKGRKFPYQRTTGRRFWENWVTREDLVALGRWKEVFGDDYEPVFVFAYWLTGDFGIDPAPAVHLFRGNYYAFAAVSATEYAAGAVTRSPKWDTLSVPVRRFRSLITPVARLCG